MKGKVSIQWIIFIVFLGTMINYMDRANISVAAPNIIKDYGWGTAKLGIVLSSFSWGYFLLQVPGGWLSDKFGGRKIMAIAGVWWSVFTALTPISKSLGVLMMIRAVLGAGESVNLPAATSIIGRWVPSKFAARVQALNLSATALGPLIATPFSVFFIGIWGWQSVFYMFAMMSIVWTAIWWFTSRRSGLPDTPDEKDYTEELPKSEDFMKTPFKSAEVWGASIAWFANSYVFYFLLTFMPTYFEKAQHVSESSLALIGTIPWFVLFIMMNVTGALSDYVLAHTSHPIFWKRMMYAAALAWAGVFMLIARGTTNSTTAVILISTAVFGLAFTWPNAWSLPIMYAKNKSGLVSGFMNACGQIAGIVAPLITGALSSKGNWGDAFTWVFSVMVLGALAILVTSKWSTDKEFARYSQVVADDIVARG